MEVVEKSERAAREPLALDKVPLLIGVTGHRDIAPHDEAALRAAFGRELARIAADCPRTQLLVISGLAAGADTLAAEEAIARGFPVFAALPMPVEMYEHDFSESERARFRALLAKCARVKVVARPVDHKSGYIALGAFLLQYAHIVFAFWDGLPGRGDGGTAEVVRARLSGATLNPDDVGGIPYLPDVGPLYQIVTPHKEAPNVPNAFATDVKYPPRYRGDPSVERDFESAIAHLDTCNDDLTKYAPAAPGVESTLHTLRERLDSVAGRLQAWTKWSLVLLYVFGGFGTAAQFVHFQYGPLLNSQNLKVTGIFLALAFFFLARKLDFENRYQDYRALAEGLRVQEAWGCAGVGREWVDAHYLRMQQSELQWIRMALRCTYLLFCEDTVEAEPCPSHETCKEWIDGQWEYYRKKTDDQQRQLQLRNTLSTALLFAGGALLGVATLWLNVLTIPWIKPYVVSALTHLHLAFAPGSPIGICGSDCLQQMQTVPMALAAVMGTLLWQWNEQRNYAANARRYHRMYIVFDHAKTRLAELGERNTAESLNVIRSLGREALIEHADWLLTRRDRPMSPVH